MNDPEPHEADKKPATNPGERDDPSKADPTETAGEEAESGGGYGNHAPDMPPVKGAN